jgi:hypothetical protein
VTAFASKTRRAAGLAWALLLGLPAWSLAEAPRAARWLPADEVLIYAEIARPGALVDQLSSDRVQKGLAAVPGYDRITDNKQLRDLKAVTQFLADSLGTTPEELIHTIAGRRVELAVVGKDRLYLVIEPNDLAELEKAHARLVELARQDAQNKGNPDPVKEKDYKGVHAYSVAPKEAHAIIDGVLVIVSDPDLLKTLVDRRESPVAAAQTLAEDALWKARRESAGEATLWGIAWADRIRKADPNALKMDKPDAGAMLLFGSWLETARQAEWLALQMTWTGERLAASLDMPAPAGGNPESWKGFIPATGQGASPPLNPPGTIATLSLWRDLAAVWEKRGELFPPESQQGFAQLDTFAGQFFGGRDFETGVLGSIGTTWRVVIARQDPQTLNPRPDDILPAFALVVDLKPDDPDFALRLKAAFQSFIGLANLGAAQQKAPPLMLGSEEFEGQTISTARYLPSKEEKPAEADEPVSQRYNFSPSAVQVGDRFVISSTLGLARDLARSLKAPAAGKPDDATPPATLLVDASGPSLAELIDQNSERLIADNMLKKGNDRTQAEAEIGVLRALVRFLGQGRLAVHDTPKSTRVSLDFQLNAPRD